MRGARQETERIRGEVEFGVRSDAAR